MEYWRQIFRQYTLNFSPCFFLFFFFFWISCVGFSLNIRTVKERSIYMLSNMFFQMQSASSSTSPVVLVVNKVDCATPSREWVDEISSLFNKRVFTCAVTGQGIPDLESAIVELVGLNKIPAGGRTWTVNQVSQSLIKFIFLFLCSTAAVLYKFIMLSVCFSGLMSHFH